MNNASRFNLFQRILCFGLMLVMLLTIAGCTPPPATDPTADTTPTTQPTQPTTAPTEPTTAPTEPTTAPTEPTTEPTTQPKPAQTRRKLVYELTQEDVDEFYRLLAECETLSLEGTDLEAIDEITALLDEQYEYLAAQRSIANILHMCDLSKQDLNDQYLDSVNIFMEAYDAYMEMTRRVYLSDTPAKDYLFEDWTEEDIAMLMAYEGEIAELTARNDEITEEYRTTEKDDIRIPLYIEFVQNNNRIAQLYGYDNYYDYAYEMVYGRDYGATEVALIREYAKQYLTSAYDKAMRNYNISRAELSEAEDYVFYDFVTARFDKARKKYVNLYLDAMPESMAEQMYQMIKVDSVFANSKNSDEGAFTTMIGDISFCYFGPGQYSSSSTVIHEAGHYYASRYTDLGAIPLDLAETHSQGNEWLFAHFLKDHIAAKPYNTVINYRLYNDMWTVFIALFIDEFEQRVYATDITGYTAEDFDALMESVCTQYFTMSYVMNDLVDINSYWRLIVVDQPVYYLSYGMSAMASIDLYTMALEDFDAAIAAYQTLCEQPQEELGFLGNLKAAGLNGPFDEEFYIELAEILARRG